MFWKTLDVHTFLHVARTWNTLEKPTMAFKILWVIILDRILDVLTNSRSGLEIHCEIVPSRYDNTRSCNPVAHRRRVHTEGENWN